MHIKSILRMLSTILLIVSFFIFGCGFFSIIEKNPLRVSLSFLIPAVIGIAFFLAMAFVSRKDEKPFLTNKDGFLFVSLSWVFASALGALPFTISGYIPSYIDAFFETMSGFTTTGASILANIEALPRALLLWRATTHWLGGMGIVVLLVAVLPTLGFSAIRVMEAEAPGPSVDRITPHISSTAKTLWLIYLGLTIIEILLLVIGGMTLFDAICHAFATMATGGFSTKNTSLAHYDSGFIHWVITIFMFLAGTNFTLHYRLLSGNVRSILKDTEFKVYFMLFAVSSIIIAGDLFNSGVYRSFGESMRFSSFQVSSILTTTGFATTNFGEWPAVSQTILFFLMFIGGCAGSTGGGIKVIRVVVLFKMAVTEMRYVANPRGVYTIFLGNKALRKNVIYDIAALVFLYFAFFFLSVIVISFTGVDILTNVTAVIANLGNIGPGLGKVGPVFNYAFFPWWAKLWLSFAMLVGRLEVYTVLVLFSKKFWRSF
jgi:trk system potassium uptake protein TrkH